jgi:hypothetical protein
VKNRIGEHDPDPDTDAFLQDLIHNTNNAQWHYVDLPLGCVRYEACPEFTPDFDIVHTINICIRTLQGQMDPAHPLSKRNALRLLVHFVGDLHQPLHVGSGYIDETVPDQIKISTDGKSILTKHLESDRGANQLIIDRDRANLHSFWDFGLVNELMKATHRETSDDLARLLEEEVTPQPDWDPKGPVATWAAQWATDSLRVSREQAYRGVQIVGRRTISVLKDGEPVIQDGKIVMQVVYDIKRPDDYLAVNREVVKQQLAKAGYRLAKLLDAILTN